MKWLQAYQLVLLDLDGLLVNTEELHFRAYQAMCAARGYVLTLSYREYCDIAHRSSEGLEAMVYGQFPSLRTQEPSWSVLYAEKKRAYIELLHSGAVQMMPGAEKFLIELYKAGVKRCVVTHSGADLADIIRKKNPVLDTIPWWFTRESYTHAKPHPDGYQKAILALATPGDNVIGFEDTLRGLQALGGTRAKRILVCGADHPCLPLDEPSGSYLHFESLSDLVQTQAL